MSLGERAAFEGLLSQLRPGLALQIGDAEEGSANRLAARAGEVLAFNAVEPAVLESLAGVGRNVDFVLVDGERSAEGIRHTLERLLDSPALASTVILIAEIDNAQVREGADAVPYAAWPKVAHVDLDWVPGHVARQPEDALVLRGGLGLVVVDAARVALFPSVSVMHDPSYPRRMVTDATWSPGMVRRVQELERELVRVKSISEHHERLWNDLIGSWSWKLTAPLRRAKDFVRRIVR